MKIQCPSCHFSADVETEKIPSKGGNTKCPRCATVFFVAPAEPVKTESALASVVCPKCGLDQASAECCEGCGIVYEKYWAAEKRRNTQVSQIAQKPKNESSKNKLFQVTDRFQRFLLMLAVITFVFSEIFSIYLHLTDKYLRQKFIAVAFIPKSTLAEAILIIFILYSFRKRRAIRNQVNINSLTPDLTIVELTELKSTTIYFAFILLILNVLLLLQSNYEHGDGAVGFPILCMFIFFGLFISLVIGLLLSKVQSNKLTFYSLCLIALSIEVISYFGISFSLLGTHIPFRLLSQVEYILAMFSTVFIIMFAGIEFYKTQGRGGGAKESGMKKIILAAVLIIVCIFLVTANFKSAGVISDADKIARANAELASMDRPIVFYGRVIDHLNSPVAGIDVLVQIRRSTGTIETRIKTDSEGKFEITNFTGNMWLIKDIVMKGYEFNRPASTVELAFENDGSFVADKMNPLTYTVRRKQPPALVLKGDFAFSFAKDVPFYEIDLVKLVGKQKDYLARFQSKDLHIDLKAKASYSPADSAYSIVIEETDANSGLIALDEMLYLTPKTGYESKYRIQVPVNSSVKKYLYIKGRQGRIYSRLDTTFKATADEVVMIVNGWTNPDGGRNVDYDEDLYSQYLDRPKTNTFAPR